MLWSGVMHTTCTTECPYIVLYLSKTTVHRIIYNMYMHVHAGYPPKIYNPPSQFSRLGHPGVLYMYVLRGFVIFSFV